MKTETLDTARTIDQSVAATSARDTGVASSHRAIQIKNILVPLDFSETSLKALQYATPFARQFGAKITLLYVVEPPVYTMDFSPVVCGGPEQLAALEEDLRAIRAKWISSELEVDTTVRQSFVFDGIVDVAREIDADLIITSTHGRTGLKHLFLGSTAENTVRKAPCPVLVVRELEHDFV